MPSFQNREPQPVDLTEFANRLHVAVDDGSLVSLFNMHLEEDDSGRPSSSAIDFKKYLLAEYMLQKAANKDDLIVLAFKLYGGRLDRDTFEYALNLIYNLPRSEASIVHGEIVDGPPTDEIRLADYLRYAADHPEKTYDRSRSSAPNRTATDFSDGGRRPASAAADPEDKKRQ